MNIVEPILFQCRFNAPARAICTPGSAVESITYAKLERAIHNVAKNALSRGLAPRMTVAIAVKDTLLYAALALGLLRLGIVVITGAATQFPETLPVDAVISDTPLAGAAAKRVLLADASWAEGDGTPPDYARLPPMRDDDICRISLTSGTTGEPKAVGLTTRVMRQRLCDDLYAKGPYFARSTRHYCDLAIGNEIGFRQMLGQLWRGGTIWFLGAEPSAILDAFVRDDIQCMTAAPFGLGQFVQAFEENTALRARFEHILCPGAGLPEALAERVRSHLCRNIYSWYGTTEVGTAAFGDVASRARMPGAAGYVCPGAAIEVTDEAGQRLPAGREGLIRIRSPEMADGYLNDSIATAAAFRDGFFVSGDLGHLGTDGMLVLTGRATTMLNLGGHKERPETIEDVLTAFAGIEQAAVFGMPDEFGIELPWALIVTRSPLDEAGLRSHCESRLMDVSVPARFIPVERIPRGANGKIERHRLRAIATETKNL